MRQHFSLASWIKKNTNALLYLLAPLIFTTTEVFSNTFGFFGAALTLSFARDEKSVKGVEIDEAYAKG